MPAWLTPSSSDALILRMTVDNRPLWCGINRFEVRVSETGEAWVERLRW